MVRDGVWVFDLLFPVVAAVVAPHLESKSKTQVPWATWRCQLVLVGQLSAEGRA